MLFGSAYVNASTASAAMWLLFGNRHDSQGNVCKDPFACYNFFESDADLYKGGYYDKP